MSMPAGCVSTADLIAHYAAVRKRLMRSHLRLVPAPAKLCCEIRLSQTISRFAPELLVINSYSQQVTGRCGEFQARKPRRITTGEIAKVVAGHFGIPATAITSLSRMAHIVLPRQVTFYLCRQLTTLSYPRIGRHLGGKDHTTCIHGAEKIAGLIEVDEKLAADVAAIRAKLAGLRP